MKIRLGFHVYEDLDPFKDIPDGELSQKEIPFHQIDGASGLEAFVHVLEGAVSLMWQKNRFYGDAWRDQGYMGNLARIMSKVSRLKNMLWRDDEKIDNEYGEQSETIDDTLYDLINLGVFMLLNRGQGNRWGNDNKSD